MYSLRILILSACWIIAQCELNPLVTTTLGTVRGRHLQTYNGRSYAAFEGIPYAKPPVQKHRFREARPVRAWHGIVEARFLHTCMQYNHYTYTVIGDEDCLHLNVYSPQLPSNDTNNNPALPVVVFIHGGAFMFGAGHSYQQNLIMDRDVVYVTFNYRLGPLGFLATEDAALPGNLGLKDQTLALKWIQQHISAFGGDPNRVTLTGLSAGGASVQLHYFAPRSRGLFARGISFSGTALCPWVLQEQPRDKAKRLAALMGCPTDITSDMLHCLTYVPARNLVEAVPKFFDFLYNPFSPFGPVVEPAGTIDAFIPEHPYELLRRGELQKLPWITTVTYAEGLYPAAELWRESKYLDVLNEDWVKHAPHLLDYNYTLDINQHEAVSQQIRQLYFDSKPISRDTYPQLVQLVGDRLFKASAQLAAKMQAHVVGTEAPVHMYLYTYRGTNSKSQSLAGNNDNLGAAHCDDVIYVLDSNIQVNTTEADRKMTTLLLDFLTSYADNGVPKLPNKPWLAVSSKITDPLHYVQIDSHDNVVQKAQDFNNVEFWLNLPFQENGQLFSNMKKDEL